jgi:hypothetical protein
MMLTKDCEDYDVDACEYNHEKAVGIMIMMIMTMKMPQVC